MRKHAGTPSRRGTSSTLVTATRPAIARGAVLGTRNQLQRDVICLPPSSAQPLPVLFHGQCQGKPWGTSPQTSAPTYLL